MRLSLLWPGMGSGGSAGKEAGPLKTLLRQQTQTAMEQRVRWSTITNTWKKQLKMWFPLKFIFYFFWGGAWWVCARANIVLFSVPSMTCASQGATSSVLYLNASACRIGNNLYLSISPRNPLTSWQPPPPILPFALKRLGWRAGQDVVWPSGLKGCVTVFWTPVPTIIKLFLLLLDSSPRTGMITLALSSHSCLAQNLDGLSVVFSVPCSMPDWKRAKH